MIKFVVTNVVVAPKIELWKGHYVRSKQDIKSSKTEFPKGTIFKILTSRKPSRKISTLESVVCDVKPEPSKISFLMSVKEFKNLFEFVEVEKEIKDGCVEFYTTSVIYVTSRGNFGLLYREGTLSSELHDEDMEYEEIIERVVCDLGRVLLTISKDGTLLVSQNRNQWIQDSYPEDDDSLYLAALFKKPEKDKRFSLSIYKHKPNLEEFEVDDNLMRYSQENNEIYSFNEFENDIILIEPKDKLFSELKQIIATHGPIELRPLFLCSDSEEVEATSIISTSPKSTMRLI
ncbi:MAG: hypothetical protein PHE67_00430 [Campylobacterales bacterium]|nr:hypothetical protein [Campylobacterales bacterium]